MMTIMITLLVIVSLSCYLVANAYMSTRDVIAKSDVSDTLNGVRDRQGYALMLHVIAILIMVAYIGKLMAA